MVAAVAVAKVAVAKVVLAVQMAVHDIRDYAAALMEAAGSVAEARVAAAEGVE